VVEQEEQAALRSSCINSKNLLESLIPFQFSLLPEPRFLSYIWYTFLFWFRVPPATKAPRGRPSPRRRAEENEKKEAETGGSG